MIDRVKKFGKSGLKGHLALGIAGAALAFAIPSAGLAVNLLGSADTSIQSDSFLAFTPASADPRLTELIAARSGGIPRMIRFTPAGASQGAERAVTVAVRVDEEAAQAISVQAAINAAREPVAAANNARMSATRYNLGLARGYRSFAETPPVVDRLSRAAIPDLAEFAPTPGVREEESRFGARITFDEEQGPAQRAPQTLEALGDQSLDVAGSYRLTPNLDVTAGVRYQQDRDRLSPLPNIEQVDSQAVYIGTQFRF